MRNSALFFLAFLLLKSPVTFSQVGSLKTDTANLPSWVYMMQDPGADFYSTQKAFEKFWVNHPDHKGNGWKVFKRWEYINSSRVQADGKLPAPQSVSEEYKRYVNKQRSVSGNWSQIGPVALPANSTGQPNGLGRINAIGFHPTDGNTFYIGSPSGGLWKTADGGITWTSLSASLPTLGVSAIQVNPTQPNVIWIGTGDRDAGDAPGLGVYKSIDYGVTWNVSNSGMGNLTVGMFNIHPTDPNLILAATSAGIYKTINGGLSWTRKSSNTNNYKDIKFKPGDPAIVYATAGGSFYRSTNTGDSWTQITSGIIAGTRLVIGVTAANSAYVYLLQTNGTFAGVLRSTNSGLNFTTQSTSPNIMDYSCDGSGTRSQAFYNLCIAVDPANANTIYLGGINIWKSTNGGSTLTINSHWTGDCSVPAVHADIHTLDFSPVNSKLFTGCDGGIYWTGNGGTNWTNISNGLAIAQVYKIGQSATNTALTINGYQDNGTASNNNSAFTTVIGGDGMECIIDYSNSNYRYGSIYYGDIRRSSGGGYSTIAANGSNGITEEGGWVTPFILHETIPGTMFIGYKNVWRSINVKASSASSIAWTMISAGETSNCSVLEQSPANVDILYVVRSGQLKRSDNVNSASVTWTNCTLPEGYTPTDLEAHPTNPDIIYATAHYGVYKSVDRGLNWSNISGNLPAIYTNCLVYDKTSNEGLYVGNETAVYFKDTTIPDWVSFNTGLPVVDIRELEIFYDAAVPANNKLKAATYGRGLWQSDLKSAPVIEIPIVTTTTPGAITSTTAISGGDVTSDGGATVTSRGVCWSTSANPVASGNHTTDGTGTGTFTSSIIGLTASTLYHIRAYATNSVGTNYGSDLQFTTAALPIPTLSVSPSSQAVTASSGSTTFNVTSNSDWTAASDQSWCTVTPSGTGDGTIITNYTANLTFTTRAASITVTVSGLSPILVTVTQQAAAAPDFMLTARNEIQTSATTLEFDVYLLNTKASTSFELASTQLGFMLNPAIFAGGSLTASLVSGTSELLISQVPTAIPGILYPIAGYPGQCLLRLAGRIPPGAGSGTIISSSGAGTRITRIKLTSTVPFAASSTANLNFTSSTAITPIYATRVAQYIGSVNTQLAVIPEYNANVIENHILNPPPTLFVAPSNHDVTSVSGNTSFAVTSNAGWTVVKNQAWCTVTASGFGNGTISATYDENTTSMIRVAEITITAAGLSPVVVTVTQEGMANKVLNLNLLLQSLYSGNGMMHPALDESGAHWGTTIADKINVELHDNSNYSNVIYTVLNAGLNTNGTSTITIPAAYNGSYFITVKHRNSIETVSAIPVSFAGSPVTYNFNLATQAYGSNLGLMIDGWWVIYGGDVSQDGGVDTGDMSPVDNDSFNYMSGFLNSDTNGDGVVDTGDMTIVDNNATNYVLSAHP